MQGTIKLIEQKTSTNGKPYGSITMESGDRYTCYDAQIYQQLKAGETIEFEPNVKTVNGKTYKRIESCTVLSAAAPPTPKTEPKASVPQQVAKETHTVDSRGKDIDFAVAFKWVGDCWTTGRMPSPADREAIYGLAVQVYKDMQAMKKAL